MTPDQWVDFEEMLTPEQCAELGISQDRPLSQCLVRLAGAYRVAVDRLNPVAAERDMFEREHEALRRKRDAAWCEIAALRADKEQLEKAGDALRDSCEYFGTTGAEYEWQRAQQRIAAWDTLRK